MTTECDICTDPASASAIITCQICSCTNCKQCIIKWGKPECLQCSNRIDRYTLVNLMGIMCYTNSFGKWIMDNLRVREEKMLPVAQKYIEWIAYQNEKKKYKRYLTQLEARGFVIKPEFEVGFDQISSETFSQGGYYKCSEPFCAGLVILGVCGMCQCRYCVHCEQKINIHRDHNHKCNDDILTSVKELRENTKKCPSCYTPIIKSEGCNAMRCTNCGTRFDWITLSIQITNSNHYKNTDILHLVGGNDLILTLDHINNAELENVLWKLDPNAINTFITSKFNHVKTAEKHQLDLLNNRVSYLQGSTSLDKWINTVFILETEYEYKSQMTYCFSMYLENIGGTTGNYESRTVLISKVNDLMKRTSISYGKKLIQLKISPDNGLPIV
jgi:hypothetical protein